MTRLVLCLAIAAAVLGITCAREDGEPDPPVQVLVPCDPTAMPGDPLACPPPPDAAIDAPVSPG